MRTPLPVVPAAALCLAGALMSTGCSSTPPPTEQFAVANASIDAARAAGAAQYAAVELNSARTKLEQAQRLAQARQPDKARELAEQADVDAQVARTKAQAERSRLAVAEVQEGLRLLRQELERGTPAADMPPAEVPPGMAPPRPLPVPQPLPAPAGSELPPALAPDVPAR